MAMVPGLTVAPVWLASVPGPHLVLVLFRLLVTLTTAVLDAATAVSSCLCATRLLPETTIPHVAQLVVAVPPSDALECMGRITRTRCPSVTPASSDALRPRPCAAP